MTTEQQILINMKMSGIIKGDEEMEWVSPNKEFKFVINRYENQLDMEYNGAHYIITIDVVNMLGVTITQLKFSEIDAVRILDNINAFLYDFSGGCGDRMLIYIDPSNLRLEGKMISLEKVRETDIYPPVKETYEEYYSMPDIKFQIFQYSYMHHNMIPLISMFLTDEDLESFAFQLFFYSLIDIDIPPRYDQQLENIVQNMYLEKLSLEHDIFK